MRIDLQDTPFAGVSRSVTAMHGPGRWPECVRCGSSLAGRLEAVRNRGTIEVDIYRCGCGVAVT
jgi:hypothetical protein